MTAPNHDDGARLADPLPMLSDAAVAELIITLRKLTEVLEFHHDARVEPERSAFNDDQLDMWDGGNPF